MEKRVHDYIMTITKSTNVYRDDIRLPYFDGENFCATDGFRLIAKRADKNKPFTLPGATFPQFEGLIPDLEQDKERVYISFEVGPVYDYLKRLRKGERQKSVIKVKKDSLVLAEYRNERFLPKDVIRETSLTAIDDINPEIVEGGLGNLGFKKDIVHMVMPIRNFDDIDEWTITLINPTFLLDILKMKKNVVPTITLSIGDVGDPILINTLFN